jgi:hypothetical protein
MGGSRHVSPLKYPSCSHALRAAEEACQCDYAGLSALCLTEVLDGGADMGTHPSYFLHCCDILCGPCSAPNETNKLWRKQLHHHACYRSIIIGLRNEFCAAAEFAKVLQFIMYVANNWLGPLPPVAMHVSVSPHPILAGCVVRLVLFQ